ncbi:MAG: CDP-alcohol phosphatidyltransferase family protein [Bacilli bacterium]|jgi:CDP-diacylglycerol--glycerol-3-phosphate 3-phosphatidyltransferase|nr:CDP-alcohol phosphatidyltransferase family protein [Bacilli bacterium]
MNLPNKITVFRMAMVVVIWLAMLFPYSSLGIEVPFIFGEVNLVYFIVFWLFVIASFSDFLDGHIARKYNLVTNFGKFMDPIADKLLVNGLLIILLVPSYHSGGCLYPDGYSSYSYVNYDCSRFDS